MDLLDRPAKVRLPHWGQVPLLARNGLESHVPGMDRDAQKAWLKELSAENLRRRAQAEPELTRKEAALRAASAELASRQVAVRELEAELETERQEADEPSDS